MDSHSGGQGRGKSRARWIAGERRKKNRAQMAEKGDVGEQGSIYRCSAEIRSQNKDRTGAELSAWRHERQVEVKVDA